LLGCLYHHPLQLLWGGLYSKSPFLEIKFF
jgi:hypothetical protein